MQLQNIEELIVHINTDGVAMAASLPSPSHLQTQVPQVAQVHGVPHGVEGLDCPRNWVQTRLNQLGSSKLVFTSIT